MVNRQFKGFITVRTSSVRLPNKCFLPFGEESVLSHVIKRALTNNIDPIICTTTEKADDPVENLAKDLKVKFYRGSSKNKLKRWLDCAIKFDINNFHTIYSDDPFFEPKEMNASMDLLVFGNYDAVYPTPSSSAGGASVGYSLKTKFIKQALSNVPDETDTEMMWYYLEQVKDRNIKILEDPTETISKIRLTLDYQEDYWLLESIRRILGNNATRKDINKLFKDNPDFHMINFFRNEEWKEAQLAKKL